MHSDSPDISDAARRIRQGIAGLRLNEGCEGKIPPPELAEIERALRKLETTASDWRAASSGHTPVGNNVIANLSHELRTPLAPALLIISALQSDPNLSEEVRGDLAIVREQIELEGRLVDSLLDTAQLRRGELQLTMQPVDLRVILHGVAATARATATLGPVIVLEIAPGETTVRGDPARLTQVFTNLVQNAIKFTPPHGSVRITAADEGNWAVVLIEDTGRGFEAGAIPKIFEAFGQESNPLREGRGGMGVGLSIAKELVALHGGTIHARSEGEGHGATFKVKLPTMKTAAALEKANAPSGKAAGAAHRKRRALRVLLVEDHGQSLLATARLVRGMGHAVFTAGSVATARALLHAETFDLLLADIELPDGTGWDLMKAAREIGPIIGVAISGHGGDADVARSLEAGFARHLVKPITGQRLTCAIDESVAGSSSTL
jgi:two-component system CheB/CheR fusion protein